MSSNKLLSFVFTSLLSSQVCAFDDIVKLGCKYDYMINEKGRTQPDPGYEVLKVIKKPDKSVVIYKENSGDVFIGTYNKNEFLAHKETKMSRHMTAIFTVRINRVTGDFIERTGIKNQPNLGDVRRFGTCGKVKANLF